MESNEANKRLDELSRDDLLKKCQHLLAIAQKAKQSKAALLEENDALKRRLAGGAEVIDKLTEQKLSLTTRLDELESQRRAYDAKLFDADNLRGSHERQIARLSEENEQLLLSLDSLERQTGELQELAERQRGQLLELERSAVSLEEVSRLRAENESKEETCERLRGKLRQYHSKITRLAGTARALREDKDHVLCLTKTHVAQVSEWKDKLGAIVRCVERYRSDDSNVLELTNEVRSYKGLCDKSVEEITSLAVENRSLVARNELLEDELADRSSYTQDVPRSSELLGEMHAMNEAFKGRGENVSRLERALAERDEELRTLRHRQNVETEELRRNLADREEVIDTLRRELAVNEAEGSKLIEEVESLRVKLASKEEDSAKLKEYIELVADLRQKLTSKEAEERKLIEEMESLRQKLTSKEDEKEMESLRINFASKEQELVKLRESVEVIKDLRQKLTSKEAEEHKLIQEMESLRRNVVASEIQESVIEELTHTLAVKESVEQKLLEMMRIEHESKEQDSIKLQESEQTIEDLRQKLISKEEQERKLMEEVESLRVELASKEQDSIKLGESMTVIEDLRQELISKEDEGRKLMEELESLRINLASKEQDSIKLEDSMKVIEDLRQKLISNEDEGRNLMESLRINLASKEQDSIKLQESEQTIEDLRQKLISKEDQERKLMEEVEDLRVKFASKEQDSIKLEDSMKLIEDLRQKLISNEDEGRNQMESLRTNLASKEQDSIKLQESVQTIEDLRQKLISKEDEERKLMEEVESLRVELASNEQNSMKVIEDLRQKLTSKEDEERKLIEQMEALRRDGELRDTIIEDLRQKLASTESEAHKLMEEMEGLRIELASKQQDSVKLQESAELLEQLERLRGELASKDRQLEELAADDSMSTSTISRSDEAGRLRELEGSWEERYGKLRALAVKLKAKVRELTGDNEELRRHIEGSVRAKDELVEKDDVINSLRKEVDVLIKERSATEEWKKRISAKVQTLRKELEANAVLRRDFESRISKLTEDLKSKEQALESEAEAHRQTKASLEQLSAECKRHSVLSLEMQDYERSSKETSRRLEDLAGQLEAQRVASEALRNRNALAEERLAAEEAKSLALRSELEAHKAIVARLEAELRDRESRVSAQTRLLEGERLERERLSLELSALLAEHERAVGEARTEREGLRAHAARLQLELREARDELELRSEELRRVADEYEAYKVRATSVLRQNQGGRDVVALEERMREEAESLGAVNARLDRGLEEAREQISSLEAKLEALAAEKEACSRRALELADEVDELKTQYGQLAAGHERTVAENAETIRSLKVHAETLSQCYRQQLSEQESRHSREIAELRGRLERTPAQTAETPQASPTMPREEGEGSESVDGVGALRPVPLERLLGNQDDDSDASDGLRKRLADEESKVTHLTALLSDTEKDLVKHVQMNELLKEEIRRQRRSVEREEHAENLEYLKNVVFKFVTLSGGDERSRLVPVLNTILKLSPEETRHLAAVARGEGSLKAWTSYLPTWPSK